MSYKIFNEAIKKFVSIEGEPVELIGLKDLRFFVHKNIADEPLYGWCVSEATSGCQVSSSVSKEGAIHSAQELAKKFGIKVFKEKVESSLEKIKAWQEQLNDPFEKAIHETGITMTETEKQDLRNALVKHKLIVKA